MNYSEMNKETQGRSCEVVAVPKPKITIKDTINELGFALREIECRATNLSRFLEMREDCANPTSEPQDMGEALQQHLELAKKVLCTFAEIEARLGM